MAVYNTTYNYNQGNMNFGQSMLLGAFGMLTGQMGGYGMGMGSYGMGCMGMGGSLFNMCGMGSYGLGMGGYGMGMYGCGMSDQYMGMQFGMLGMGILFKSINNSITEHKAQKAATKQATETANNNIEALKTKQKELAEEKTALSEAKDFINNGLVPSGVSKYFPTEAEAYTKQYKIVDAIDKKTAYNGYENKTSIIAIKDGITTEIKDGKTEYKFKGEACTDENDAKTKQAEALDAEVKKLRAAEHNVEDKKLDTAYETLTEKINKRLDEIKTEETKNKKDLTEAQKTLEESGAEIKLSRSCDTPDEYNKIVGNKYNKETGKFEDVTVTDENKKSLEKAFNYKFRDYCKCSADDKNKAELRKEALALYELFDGSTSKDMDKKKDILESGKKIGFGLE